MGSPLGDLHHQGDILVPQAQFLQASVQNVTLNHLTFKTGHFWKKKGTVYIIAQGQET